MLKKYKLQQCKLLNGKKKLSCVHLVFAWNKVCSSSFTLYTTCCKFLVTNKIIKKRIQTSFRGVIISTHTKLNLPFSPFHSKAIHLKYDFFFILPTNMEIFWCNASELLTILPVKFTFFSRLLSDLMLIITQEYRFNSSSHMYLFGYFM